MVESGSISSELIPLGKELHRYLQKTGTYEQVRNWLARRTAYPIILVGATGVGKSSLLRSFLGEDPFIRREDRTDEVKELTAKIENKLYVKLFDTPGEMHHASKRRSAYQNAMRYNSVGIINVVSFGYHEAKGPFSEAVTGRRPSEDFLDMRRSVEIQLLNEWKALLCGDAGPASWIATVVTKADLWWSPGPDQPVIDYYSNGSYSRNISEGNKLPHSVRSYSSINHLFYGAVPMSGFYSDQQRQIDYTALIAYILEKSSQHG